MGCLIHPLSFRLLFTIKVLINPCSNHLVVAVFMVQPYSPNSFTLVLVLAFIDASEDFDLGAWEQGSGVDSLVLVANGLLRSKGIPMVLLPGVR